VPHRQITLRVDATRRGVGGDTQWSKFGKPLPAYLINLAAATMTFRLTPFIGEETRPNNVKVAAAVTGK